VSWQSQTRTDGFFFFTLPLISSIVSNKNTNTNTQTMVVPSVAGQVLRSRALQCSFSSVFHLRRAGMQKDDAKLVENVFLGLVGVPLVILTVTGLGVSLANTIGSNETK
jgi:hypothetical protein